MSLLTNAEKREIVDQHIRNVDFSTYNTELEIATASAVSSPDQATLDVLNARLADLQAKRQTLETEKASLL